jgi:alkanesulfonate monooxygenase SsuD/methylene tetrahydromethanopterin reductase-like flavin-dependent oxidoreductase (luciferase family)
MIMATDEITIGIKASQQHATIDETRQLWRAADDGGFDSCWAFDHLVPMGRVRAGDIFEAWTLLAAMAEATSRVRIGTAVTSNLYRHPALLAKMAVTVDHVSGGRLDVGLGAGGDELADSRLGLPAFPARERIARLDEACQILNLLWTKESTTFAGEHYRLEDAPAEPKPLQSPRPPLWLGSSGERYGLRVVARHADVWLNASLSFDDVDELVRLSGVLDRHCDAIGRDPATIRRAVQFRLPGTYDETAGAVARYVRAGFTDLLLMPYVGGAAAVAEAAGWLPGLRMAR